MKKFFKWLSIILLTIVGLFIALIIALPFLIDPNDFKNEIAARVQQHTGRVLTIDGDIQLSVFPWLGLQLGKTQLSNAPGFGQQPMLQLENIKLGVKLLPLLRQELQTDETTLNGLQVNFLSFRCLAILIYQQPLPQDKTLQIPPERECLQE